ncbi:MAG: hypothetical protein GY859_03720, partial [Desulfobacterales bacterium]|nr:hypothetical protein [Desulfobacterales bacterium]
MAREEKVIFLDIDGVLQPTSAQDRFRHDMDELQERLIRESDEGYGELNKYDIAAVQYDWHEQAVDNLRSLCEKTGANIVISSDWRSEKTLEQLKLLFKIHGLDSRVVGMTEEGLHCYRDTEIEEYLIAHPDIGRFTVLDDRYVTEFERRYPDQFVYCDRIFDDESYEKALSILNGETAEKELHEALEHLEQFRGNAEGVTRAEFTLRRTTLIRRRHRITSVEMLDRICDAVAANTRVEELAIHGVGHDFPVFKNYGVIVGDKLGQSIGKNESVKRLDVSDNSLDDITGLIAGLKARETAITHLDLSKNSLNEAGQCALAENIREASVLKRLNLEKSCQMLRQAVFEALADAPDISATANVFQRPDWVSYKSVPGNLKLIGSFW